MRTDFAWSTVDNIDFVRGASSGHVLSRNFAFSTRHHITACETAHSE
jgi:hypothetical protein